MIEKKLDLKLPSRIQSLELKHSKNKKLNIFLKRDDEIHPIVCGNKWRKLKYNLLKVNQLKTKQIISFGGAWSNHLHALGWCCHQLQIRLIAMVRGEPGRYKSTMISDLEKWGTKIHWLNREDYRHRSDENWLKKIQQQYDNAVVIAEGGSNQYGLQGVVELANEAIQQFSGTIDYFCVAVGSGGTLAGLSKGFEGTETQLVGIPVLKGASDLENRIIELLANEKQSQRRWELVEGYEFGGYARYTKELCHYLQEFYDSHGIILEPVYTAKLFWGVEDLIRKDFFKEGSNIVLLHSGGLQGLRGITKFSMNRWLNRVTAGN